MYKKVFYVTPKDINYKNSRNSTLFNLILLENKSALLPYANEISTYNIGSNTFYQYNVRGDNTAYEVVVFDKDFNVILIDFVNDSGVDQSFIDSILATLIIK